MYDMAARSTSARAAANCPALCAMAQMSEIPIKLNLPWCACRTNSAAITRSDPHREKINDAGFAKSRNITNARVSEIAAASAGEWRNAATVIAMFASPGLKPGRGMNLSGSIASRYDRASAIPRSAAPDARRATFLSDDKVRIAVSSFARYFNNDLCGYANDRLSVFRDFSRLLTNMVRT